MIPEPLPDQPHFGGASLSRLKAELPLDIDVIA